MFATLPQLHAALLGLAAFTAVAIGGVILARAANSKSARLHFVYAVAVGWWFVCMAMMARSSTASEVSYWGRLVHLSLGMLPGILFHLNTALAGLVERRRARVVTYWLVSVAVTAFTLLWPRLFGPPSSFPWGPYIRYSGWGLIVVAAIVIALVDAELGHRQSLARSDPRSALARKVRMFYLGNLITALALLDFLPAFGVGWYPFGFGIITAMHGATLYGSIRYRITELTPEFAVDHVLGEMPDGLLLIDIGHRVRVANPVAAILLHTDLDELVGRDLPPDRGENPLFELLRRPGVAPISEEVLSIGPAGSPRYVRASRSPLADQEGVPVAHLWTLRDITSERAAAAERARFETSVRDAQKLESLGVMASGVAHDFNNLLLTILGNAELAEAEAGDAGAVREHLEKIAAAAHRAAELTGQMLTYTGMAHTDRRALDLNDVVREVAALMRAAISKKATLSLQLREDLPKVLADPIQMSQVILNLITNASEALEGRVGSIVLRTGVTRPDESFHRWEDGAADPQARDYVFLQAVDSGRGMDEAILDRIFDPFFTTKFKGRGLGLATVVGIVRAHQGMTRVVSTPEQGTDFAVLFPVALEASPAKAHPKTANGPWKGRGVALLADDEPEVRSVTKTMLSNAGFSVIETSDGREAVAAFEARPDDIAVVIMDRTMPDLDGREAFARIRAMASDVPFVFISGYIDQLSEASEPHTQVLHKPFTSATLTTKVREAILGA